MKLLIILCAFCLSQAHAIRVIKNIEGSRFIVEMSAGELQVLANSADVSEVADGTIYNINDNLKAVVYHKDLLDKMTTLRSAVENLQAKP